MSKPLTGIRVVDLSRLLPGPLASLILGDLGAEVISVDSAHNPDYMHAVPPLCDDGVSLFFHALQRGKTRVSIDLRSEEGKASLRKLLQEADVLLESYRPGVLSSLGFNDNLLTRDFPGLIVCHLSGYGQEGDKAKVAGHDLNFVAESGLLGLFDKPGVLPFPVADIGAGSFGAVIQILAALLKKKASQKGTIIDHNITAFCAALAIPQWVGSDAAYVLSGHEPQYSVYETSDGHVAVAALESKFWKVLVGHLGLPENASREQLQSILTTKTTAEWECELGSLNICVSPVRKFGDAAALATRPKGVTVEGVTMSGKSVELPRLF
jgi:alpha-methylacyl-CoA racemase